MTPMEDASLWSSVFGWAWTATLAVALAAAAGLRAWLPLLVAGVLTRLGVADLGSSFGWLASWPALGLLGGATLIEVVGDKIPVVDHVLDTIGTVIRPLAGALAAAAALVQVDDPMIALVIGLLVGAPVALAPHVAKSSVRAVSTTSTAGLANPVISFIEDVLSFVIAVLAFLAPVLVVLLLLVSARLIWRWLQRRRTAAPGGSGST